MLSRRWTLHRSVDPLALYRALRATNPSPYMFFLSLGETKIVGASPEVLVRVEEGEILLRPIAGTRPRGADAAEDAALAADHLADQKELAEHRMLVDLARNDAGRVAEVGTVEVHLNGASHDDPLLAGFPSSIQVQAWHTQTVLRMPPGARRLASNAMDAHHAFALDERAWGV